MKAMFRPNQPIKPASIVVASALLVVVVSGIVAGIRKAQDIAAQQAQQPTAEKLASPLMQQGLSTLTESSTRLDDALIAGLAWQYLQQANATGQPILWVRKRANDISYDIGLQYNTRLLRSEPELEQLNTFRLRSQAIGLLMNAIAQDKISSIRNEVDLFPLLRESNNLRSLFDSQVVERRYPDEK